MSRFLFLKDQQVSADDFISVESEMRRLTYTKKEWEGDNSNTDNQFASCTFEVIIKKKRV